MSKGQMISRSINKTMQSIDAINEERIYLNNKFSKNIDLIDIKAKEDIKVLEKLYLYSNVIIE